MNPRRALTPWFVLCACVLASAACAAPTAPPRTQRAEPPPAAIVRLTDDPANAMRPTWSPDNNRIAFESSRNGAIGIFVMNADGTGLRALTTGPSDDRHAAWSPDGNSILYDSADGARQDIWTVDVAGGRRRQLTRVPGRAECPAMSPDGRRIAFYVYDDLQLNLWTVRADGGEARPLTRDLADARRGEPTMCWQRPAWSADSQRLAYTGGDGTSIWTMRSDGSDARQIVSDGETNHFPWFLPDGRLAYITEYVPPRYGAAWTNAWALDAQTGQRALLHEFMSMQGPVDWSRDGTKALFHSPRDGRFDVYVVDLKAPGGLAALRGQVAATSEAAGK